MPLAPSSGAPTVFSPLGGAGNAVPSLFGNAATPANNKPAATAFSFGATTVTKPRDSAPPFQFGSNPAAPAVANLISQTSSAVSSTFGSQTITSAVPTFGSQAINAAVPTFGQSTNQTTGPGFRSSAPSFGFPQAGSEQQPAQPFAFS